MAKQDWGLIAISLGMCGHALWIGHLLASPFAIVALAWLWIGVATALGRLDAAQAMAIIMSVLLLLASIGLGIANYRETNALAHLALALCPAFVAFACVAFYVRHLRQQAAAGYALDWAAFTREVAAMPIALPKAKKTAPVAVGSGERPALFIGANDQERPAAMNVRNISRAA